LTKPKLISLVVLIWLIASAVYAYYYVVTILALPEEYDAYARNWQFQLLMFSLFRLPWLVLALAVLIGLIIALPKQSAVAHVPPDISTG
jgi:hypothetical protein